MATIVVNEDLAHPATLGKGGHVMFLMQWLHSLAATGHEIVFVETLEEQEDGDVGRARIAWFESCIRQHWSLAQAALVVGSQSVCGLATDRVAEVVATAAAVVRLSAPYGSSPAPPLDAVRPRVLVDTDPGYTHLWAGDDAASVFGEFDAYFTVGANVGTERSALPACGIDWRHVWNPVVLDWWSGEHRLLTDRFTTIADWRGYGYLEFEGAILGPKSEEFETFLDLPSAAGEELVLLLNIDDDDPDVERLRGHGWAVELAAPIDTADGYRNFVRGSLGEFSCAKGGYVGTRSGWFSDRSTCYLAAGRPVVLQATGFEDVLPTGEGLFAVSSVAEAADAIRAIRGEYARHSAAARRIAAEHLDGRRIARQVLEAVGL